MDRRSFRSFISLSTFPLQSFQSRSFSLHLTISLLTMANKQNGLVQLEFLTTGTVRIRPSMRSQPVGNFAILRRLKSIFDREWTESLPVGVFLIRHPEGIFLF